jgi:hypothetical protein
VVVGWERIGSATSCSVPGVQAGSMSRIPRASIACEVQYFRLSGWGYWLGQHVQNDQSFTLVVKWNCGTSSSASAAPNASRLNNVGSAARQKANRLYHGRLTVSASSSSARSYSDLEATEPAQWW